MMKQYESVKPIRRDCSLKLKIKSNKVPFSVECKQFNKYQIKFDIREQEMREEDTLNSIKIINKRRQIKYNKSENKLSFNKNLRTMYDHDFKLEGCSFKNELNKSHITKERHDRRSFDRRNLNEISGYMNKDLKSIQENSDIDEAENNKALQDLNTQLPSNRKYEDVSLFELK